MKGVKKWFIVFLILSGLFVPSLLTSSDVNATRHNLTAIPLYSDTIWYGSVTGTHNLENNPFTIEWSRDYSDYAQVTPQSRNFIFYSTKSSSSCVYDSIGSLYRFSDNHLEIGFYSYIGITSATAQLYPDFSALAQCNQTAPFGSTLSSYFGSLNSHPDIISSTIPNNLESQLRQLLPYYYPYSGFYVSRNHQSSDGTYSYDTSLSSKSITGTTPNKFSKMIIPFGRIDSSIVGIMTSGRSFEFRGLFHFDGSMSYSSTFLNSGSFKLNFWGVDTLPSDDLHVHEQSIDCNLRTISSSGNIDVTYSCPLILDQNYSVAYAEIYIYSDDYIWDTSDDWSWTGMFLVSDYDETLGSNLNPDVTGNYVNESPNGDSSVPSDSDWFSSLVNLFQFNLLNPFSGLFAMFTDSSHCVNIPIIAGMLNSTETQYCSWFPSSVRSVLTPVIGVSSIMLLFGFFVRWLGSSSGNMFEDQTSHKWGNTQIKKGGK